MLNSVDFSGRPFHFIGIGGIGMSALAYVLTQKQLPVYGSDLCLNHITQRLQENGAHIFWSQDAANLETFKPVLPQVICSTAVTTANPEYRAALELGCPILHRSDLLAALIQESHGIAVAGTHGKTTTSSMIGYMLWQAGLDPTIVIGGEVTAWEGNAKVGQGEYLVAEADESDGSLVKFAPQIGVITNVELDHPDHYSSLEQVVDIFQTFANQCQTLIGCIDSPALRGLQPSLTYSLSPDAGADYWAEQIQYGAAGTVAEIWERGKSLGQLKIKLLGTHNLSNALAAVAVGRHLGLEFSQIAAGLAGFEGARRRFEHRGEANQILFIDDYAHHPSEVQVTLAAARLRVEDANSQYRRVVAVFQPHRYSRTLTFLDDFAESFGDADLVLSTDIYSAGEPDLGQISGLDLAEAIGRHQAQVVYQSTLQSVSAYLMETLMPGDLVLFLGAGNLNRIIPELVTFYQQVEQTRQTVMASGLAST
ncbi:MAG: UDP-N-acetylmuramate--L-alanine ligase [Pegethrix bostrychoides GSE-TBD4-15B]|jgi:UDP-N-acetylmuramate--alanine ligase|uniref:UDP-N-acetylmuramate--L-alanine ligase n=1 Tax=Pegethrix bostrychoides GSE-TBD4-15B TaxID=2839662 RepID=A0A951PC38_9CYAN|nr:UDP-N-acetylmuramate--L-alanine ligase [Pegethrix bostrychoides GSE-TBD4-15B]